jgi:hypothetical protein
MSFPQQKQRPISRLTTLQFRFITDQAFDRRADGQYIRLVNALSNITQLTHALQKLNSIPKWTINKVNGKEN